MQYRFLGNTNIKVSRLCFGSLTISPLQANFSYEKGAELIKYAYDKGINFIDTAEIYNNYGHIRKALEKIKRKDLVIATKSYSYSKETAKSSLNKALKELNTDYIDIFLLHEQESEHTIRGHYEAIEYFMKCKEKGIIKAIGISTHNIKGVKAFNKYDELDIVHPIINKSSIGIQDGNKEEMIKEINKAYRNNKGIYAMKPLGGGHLIKEVEKSFNYVKNIDTINSIAIGMQSKLEINANISLINEGYIPERIKEKISKKKRKLHIADWCQGCGKCVNACTHGGIKIINNKAVAVLENCVFCGYCGRICPEFCIKVI
ncbi:MAG: 4Fe-4S dicluster domain-containing protein [Firmicutes bacterium]|nr:4Fe-4S dicluster domain-containing protein [Bacillota bacterium]